MQAVATSTTNKHCVSPDQRFLCNIADAKDTREDLLQREEKERHNDVRRLGTGKLPLPTNHTSRRLKNSSRNDRGAIADLAEASRSASPPTPPISSISSQDPNNALLSVADILEDIARLQTSLEDHQFELYFSRARSMDMTPRMTAKTVGY